MAKNIQEATINGVKLNKHFLSNAPALIRPRGMFRAFGLNAHFLCHCKYCGREIKDSRLRDFCCAAHTAKYHRDKKAA